MYIPPGFENSFIISSENILDRKFESLSSVVDVLTRTRLFPVALSVLLIPMFTPLLSLRLVILLVVMICGVIVLLVFGIVGVADFVPVLKVVSVPVPL